MATPVLAVKKVVKTMEQRIQEGLSQAKRDYVLTGKLPEEMLNILATKDPTPQKKYIEWICRVFVNGGLGYGEVRNLEAVKDFNDLCNRGIIKPPDTDINRYKTLESLVDIVIRNSEVKTKTQVKKDIKLEGAELKFENDKCSMYKILTKEASCLYGSGTKWCTASTERYNYFSSYFYDRGANLFYVVPKGDLLHKIGKWAVVAYPDKHKEFYNQADASCTAEQFRKVAVQLDLPFGK